MKRRQLSELGSPESVVEAVKAKRPKRARTATAHGPATEVVRTACYKEHDIVVRTTYAIEVDGTPITGHFGVSDDGQVHYHAVPNIGFASAVDMVKKLIDTFPDDFPGRCENEEHGHDPGHDNGGGH